MLFIAFSLVWFTKLKGRGIFTFFITFFLEDQTNFLVSFTSELFLNILSKKPHLLSETQLIPAKILFFYMIRYISGAWPAYRPVGPGLQQFLVWSLQACNKLCIFVVH